MESACEGHGDDHGVAAGLELFHTGCASVEEDVMAIRKYFEPQ